MCADSEVMRYLSGTMTREQCQAQLARFERGWKERGFGLWAAEDKTTGTFIGFVGLLYSDDWPEDDYKIEVGWRIDRSF